MLLVDDTAYAKGGLEFSEFKSWWVDKQSQIFQVVCVVKLIAASGNDWNIAGLAYNFVEDLPPWARLSDKEPFSIIIEPFYCYTLSNADPPVETFRRAPWIIYERGRFRMVNSPTVLHPTANWQTGFVGQTSKVCLFGRANLTPF